MCGYSHMQSKAVNAYAHSMEVINHTCRNMWVFMIMAIRELKWLGFFGKILCYKMSCNSLSFLKLLHAYKQVYARRE